MYELATACGSVLVMAICFVMLRYFPSRREFDMHVDNDNERHDDIKLSLARIELAITTTKGDIIREFKNGAH